MNYRQLISEHDRIDLLAKRLERTVETDRCTASEADPLLAELARTVAAHLAHEDSFIYPDLARSNDPADATSLIADWEQLKADWEGYLADWLPVSTSADWPAFRRDTTGMLQRLRDRVSKETALLYPVALRHGLIAMASEAP